MIAVHVDPRPVFFDAAGAIGRRYARQDEAGTPFCITIDGDKLGKEGAQLPGKVTIRKRDTLEQVRVDCGQVVNWLKEKLGERSVGPPQPTNKKI